MDFAKNLMKKYGWEEGKGIGKNNDGIVKALKPNLKFDNSGLGLDQASDFNNHWWERVFNEAANNIDIKKEEGKVSIETRDSEGVEISTKDYSVRKLQKLKGKHKHGNFLRASVLQGSKTDEIAEKIDTNDIKFKEYRVLTDDELFAACGGRTAHKGARHGLNMKGKLSRIEEQEKELLLKMSTHVRSAAVDSDTEWVTPRKKKRKSKVVIAEDTNNDELNDILYTTEYCPKKKKKDKRIENELTASMSSSTISETNNQSTSFTVSKKQQNINIIESNDGELLSDFDKNLALIKMKENKLRSVKQEEIRNRFKGLTSDDEGGCFENSSDVEEEEESTNNNNNNNSRADEVYKKKASKKKTKQNQNSSLDEKSKSISKCAKKKEKKKLNKSLKKINEKLEKALSFI